MQNAHEQDTIPGSKRINRGYALREDLILDCKRIALEEGRKLYEVMEEALSEYTARRKGGTEHDQGH